MLIIVPLRTGADAVSLRVHSRASVSSLEICGSWAWHSHLLILVMSVMVMSHGPSKLDILGGGGGPA